jgi:hypothetical protein
MGSGTPTERLGLPPAAIARRVDGEDRHRAVARALHAGPPPRTPQITEKLEELRSQIAMFRARAIDLHVKLVELESKGDSDVRALRSAMMASVVRIEGVVRALVETPDPAGGIEPPNVFAEGTRVRR